MTKIRFSTSARADFVEIRKYSNEQFGADVADSYFAGFDELFSMLRRHPLSGAAKPALGNGIRYIIYRKHRVFYRYNDKGIVIVRIVHHARDARSIFRG